MGANQDIQSSVGQFSQHFLLFGSRLKTVDIIYITWKIFQAFFKSTVMLVGKYGGWYQNGNLLAVAYSLKCCPDGNFGFTKPNITTYEPVHGMNAFHIFFNIGSALALIRCVFIHK